MCASSPRNLNALEPWRSLASLGSRSDCARHFHERRPPWSACLQASDSETTEVFDPAEGIKRVTEIFWSCLLGSVENVEINRPI